MSRISTFPAPGIEITRGFDHELGNFFEIRLDVLISKEDEEGILLMFDETLGFTCNIWDLDPSVVSMSDIGVLKIIYQEFDKRELHIQKLEGIFDTKEYVVSNNFNTEVSTINRIVCLCVNDANKPVIIPEECWVKAGEIYHATGLFHNQIQSTDDHAMISITLEEVSMNEQCKPYEHYNINRFLFRLEDQELLKALGKACSEIDWDSEIKLDDLLK